jgi:hypothetical protein
MEPLTPRSRLRRAPHVIAEPVGDVVVALDPRTDVYVRLNATGALLWEALAEPLSVARAADRLREAHPSLGEERALADTLAYLADLLGRGLVEPV